MRYETDLTNEQWELVEPFVRQKPGPGAKREVDTREVVNAILYLVRTGCQWRMLPKDFPPRSTVNYYYGKWRDDGSWSSLNAALVVENRRRQGRKAEPSLGVLDSQSVKSSDIREERGVDGHKKVKGRKRQLFTDSQGHLLAAIVHAANVADAIGGRGGVGMWAGALFYDHKGAGGPRLSRTAGSLDPGGVQRGLGNRSQTRRATGVRAAAHPLGHRADHSLAQSLSTVGAGLRKAGGHE